MCSGKAMCCCSPSRSGGSGVMILVVIAHIVAGVIIAPFLLAMLGIIASIVNTVVWGMIACCGIMAGGYVLKEIIGEILLYREMTRDERPPRVRDTIERQTVHVITDARHRELPRTIPRAIGVGPIIDTRFASRRPQSKFRITNKKEAQE